MSSVSDSALGMGESDSRGSIQQPLVDCEVVPIGDSSSERFLTRFQIEGPPFSRG